MAERRWTITGWHEGSPGTGGVYVQGPGLEPGEQVTVVEVPEAEAPQRATMQLELFQALMIAIKRLEAVGGETADLREVANRVADPYQED